MGRGRRRRRSVARRAGQAALVETVGVMEAVCVAGIVGMVVLAVSRGELGLLMVAAMFGIALLASRADRRDRAEALSRERDRAGRW